MKVTPIESTPFATVQMNEEEQDFVIVIGNQIVSPKHFQSEDECKDYVLEKSWELLATTIMVLCEKVIDNVKLRNND